MGIVFANSETGVRAYDPGPNNGWTYFYIQNRTEEGTGTDPMTNIGGFDVYDPEIDGVIMDWQVGDECINVINKDNGTYGIDHAGYVTFTNTTLDDLAGTQTTYDTELQKIPTPTISENGSAYINISWSSIEDPNGLTAGYTIYRSTTNGTVGGDADWSLVGGTVDNPITDLTFNDTTVVAGQTYYYSLKIVFTGYQYDDPGNVDNYECAYFGEGSSNESSPPGPLTVDYIIITDSPNGTALTTEELGIGGTLVAYASGYNNTGSEYVRLVEVEWNGGGGSWSPGTGTSSNYTAGTISGVYTQTGLNLTMSVSDDFEINILPPTVDFMIITDLPNGTSLTTVTVEALGNVSAYASGYNFTGPTYVDLVDVDWIGTGGIWAPDNGTNSTFFAGSTPGLFTQTAQNTTLGVSDIFEVNIIPNSIDYIVITDGPNGTALTTVVLGVGGTVTAYASGFNLTGPTYVDLVEVNWSGLGGSWSPQTGASSTFTAGLTPGFYTQTGENLTLALSDTFEVEVLTATVDYIAIVDTPGSGLSEILDMTVDVGFALTGYAAGFNYTSGYVTDVSVTWTVVNSGGATATTAPGTGTFSTFDSGFNGGTTTWTADNGGGRTDTVVFTINPPTLDYIIIVDSAGGGVTEIADQTVDIGFTITGYAAGFNLTSGYVNDTYGSWTVINSGSSSATTAPGWGDSSTFDAGLTGGTATWIADYGGGLTDTVVFTINPPTLDYIIIVDSAGGGVTEIADQTVDIGFTITGYAAGFNTTSGYVNDTFVTWTVINSGGSTATTAPGFGDTSTFDAGFNGGIATWTADYGSGITDTVIFTISPPLIDYIIIVDTAGTGTSEILDQMVYVGIAITGYAAGFNSTSGYLYDVSVTWTVVNLGGATATTSPGSGDSSTFDSGYTGGNATWVADYGGGITDTVFFTIYPPTVDYIVIVDTAGTGINDIPDQTLNVGVTITGYSAGFNSTSGYVTDVSASWDVTNSGGATATTTPGPSSSADFYAGLNGGTATWTADYGGGMTDTVVFTINPPTVDYITITDSPNGAILTTVTLGIGGSLIAYASSYNNTGPTYVGLREVNWSGPGGSWSPGLGSSSTFTAGLTPGIFTQTGENITLAVSDDFEVNIINYTLDFILITDAPNGTELLTINLPIGGTFKAYASGYNFTGAFLGLVDVEWSGLGGEWIPGKAKNSTYTAGLSPGLYTQTGENLTLGLSDTFSVNIQTPTIDYIVITDAPNGTEIMTATLPFGGTLIAYASAYNNTGPTFIELITADWIGLGGTWSPGSGNSSTFTAGIFPGLYLQTVENSPIGVSDTFFVDVIGNLTVDYIVITDAPNGTELITITLSVGEQITVYASGYNLSTGYIELIEVEWSESSGLGIFDSSSGTSTIFTAGMAGGSTTITGENTNLSVSDSFAVNIYPPTIDYILLTGTPGGTEFTTITLLASEQVTIYASGYNVTSGYVDLVFVFWDESAGLGSFDNTTGASTIFTAGIVGGLTTISGENFTYMISDSFDVNITSATVDYIQIRDSPSGGGSVITNLLLNVGEPYTLWAAAYNYSSGYLGDFSSTTWVESSGGSVITVTGSGASTLILAQMIGGSSTITADYGGIQNTTNVIVNSPTVNYVRITDSPNGPELITVSLNVGEGITIYASGYNGTSGYTGLVEVNWSATLVLGIFDNLTGKSTTFIAGFTGGSTSITGENALLGVSDSFNITINPPMIDYIILTDSPNGSELITVNLDVGESVTVYASGYNSTSGYVDLLHVNWSESMGLGVFNTIFGRFTTFTAGFIGGSTMVSGENATLVISDTFEIIINPPTVDFIILTDSPDGTELTSVILNVGESITIYSSGYNTTSGYVDLVDVNWDEPFGIGNFDILYGDSTTFTAGLSGGSSTISGENLTLDTSDSFDITITAPTADYILIRTQSGGGGINLCEPVNYQSYPVGASDLFYSAEYNNTAGYIGPVPGTSIWSSSDSSIVTLISPGNSTTITCSETSWGAVIITLNDGFGHTNTTQVTVLQPTIDYIQIRDEPGGSGNIVTTETYIVWQVVNFYAATYNYTAEYLGEIEANWASSDTTVGTVTTPGHWTNFTALKVDYDGVCQVTAEFHGIENSTGDLLILAPTIDFIMIMDSLGGTGDWVGDMTFNEGDSDVFWCAGFNYTADYVKDVEAFWESNNSIVGSVNSGPDEFTNFTAGWRGGYCRITATYDSIINETGDIYVININQLPTSNAEYHNETGFTGGSFSFDANITLRVAGRKDNIITMGLKEDDTVVEEVTVTRTTGEPNIGVISYEMGVQYSYEVILGYEGYNGGSNPIIVTFEFLGNIYSVHLLFNSQHGEEQTAIIDFDDISQMVGVVFFDGYGSSDFEGYLVDYHWEFGDGTEGSGMTLAHTYEENGIYNVNLTVTDDEGGTDTDTIIVYIENIDNNNQVNAILGSNASQGYLNGSGQYVVILECPADLVITNKEGRQIGLAYESLIKEIPGAFVSKLYSDIEVYFVPYDEIYNIIVDGNGYGTYNLSVIGVSNDLSKKYSIYNVICRPGTQDIYNFGFEEETISISTQEHDKYYSLEFLNIYEGNLDRFYLTDMSLGENATHAFKINTWDTLSSGKPVTLFIDVKSDGVYEDKVDLESGLNGEDVDRLLIRQPVSTPGFPIFLFIVVGSAVAIGVCGLLTEVGKWTLLSLLIPMYSRIKKDKILDQPIRYKIHGFILGNPGAHFGLIKHVLELPNGQLAHHLNQLIRTDLIYSKADGSKKRFYPMNYPKSRENGRYLSSLQEKILTVINENSGISQKKVASKIGISRQVAGYHLTLMEQSGVIKKEIVGRECRYYT